MNSDLGSDWATCYQEMMEFVVVVFQFQKKEKLRIPSKPSQWSSPTRRDKLFECRTLNPKGKAKGVLKAAGISKGKRKERQGKAKGAKERSNDVYVMMESE